MNRIDIGVGLGLAIVLAAVLAAVGKEELYPFAWPVIVPLYIAAGSRRGR